MRKIKVLLDRGWQIEFLKRTSDDWVYFNVAACHSFWGDVNTGDETLNKAIDKMYDEAKKLELK